MENCGCTPSRMVIYVWWACTEKSPQGLPISMAEKGMQKQKNERSSNETGVIEAKNARFSEWPSDRGTVR